jgi:hypothetical protein
MHACILVGYLSTDKISKLGITEQEQRSRNQRLFHESMKIILNPLVDAGRNGVEMSNGLGEVRLVFPILAVYVADFPEQCLVACAKSGTCPKCQCPADSLQHTDTDFPARSHAWTLGVINEARVSSSSTREFYQQCMEREVSGSIYKPFWADLPLANIHQGITPDVLHQLYQGVFLHLINWCQAVVPAGELDRRIRCLPPGFGVRYFKDGISSLSQVSGPERKNIAKVLLGCLVGLVPAKALTACRALLDFIYLAQYSTHDTVTLRYMKDALDLWNKNRSFFVDTLVRDHFNIPKFHSLVHYVESIENFGTTDNYNTEMFERFHIDFAKQGWRASNKRNEFPQMTLWLSRQEKIAAFASYISSTKQLDNISSPQLQNFPSAGQLKIAKHPSHPHRLISTIEKLHNAPGFSDSLKAYLNRIIPNSAPTSNLIHYALPFTTLDVFDSFKFQPSSDEDEEQQADTVKASPAHAGRPAQFDTVVVMYNSSAESTGLAGKVAFYLKYIS